ncbi:MAG TPA: universal stress protein [Sphingobacterium sp.]|nr:universal stress protein [Sphingobacterium sp.]
MNNILIPTDFSENADKAFLCALKIANQYNANLYVVHSHQSPVLSFSHAGQPQVLEDVYNEISLSKFDFFKKRTPELHKLAEEHHLGHDKIIFLFEEGTVLDAVIRVIKREQIDLVVMGTLGASGFQKQFLGTNTVSVIRNTRIPILCIPAEAELLDIKKIAFTTVFREKDKEALSEIVDFANSFGAQVYCTHVVHEHRSPADILQYSEIWRKAFNKGNLDFIFLEKQGSVENTIHQFIRENNIDLLAVVKRNRNFFDRLVSSSLSNNLAFHSQTPILVFHEES